MDNDGDDADAVDRRFRHPVEEEDAVEDVDQPTDVVGVELVETLLKVFFFARLIFILDGRKEKGATKFHQRTFFRLTFFQQNPNAYNLKN